MESSPYINLFIFVIGLAFTGAGIYLLQQSVRFHRQGIITVGQVIAVRKIHGRGGTVDHPIIRFTALPQGTTIEFTESIGLGSIPKRFQVGREVRIRYLPTNPQQAQLMWIWNSFLLALLVLGIGLFFAIFLAWRV